MKKHLFTFLACLLTLSFASCTTDEEIDCIIFISRSFDYFKVSSTEITGTVTAKDIDDIVYEEFYKGQEMLSSNNIILRAQSKESNVAKTAKEIGNRIESKLTQKYGKPIDLTSDYRALSYTISYTYDSSTAKEAVKIVIR